MEGVTIQETEAVVGLNFMKNVREIFQCYCQAAILGENLENLGYLLMKVVHEFTVSNLKSAFLSYTGANLILTAIPEVVD